MIELLIQNGADINAVNDLNNSALILALDTDRGNHLKITAQHSKWFFKRVILSCSGYKEAAKLLIRKGADVNIVGQDGNTALIVALNKGFDEIAQIFIKKGANVNHKNKHGTSAIILAALKGELASKCLNINFGSVHTFCMKLLSD